MTKQIQVDSQKLKTLRKLAKLTQKDVAKRLGVTYQCFSEKESGKRMIKAEELATLASLYDTPIYSLFKDGADLEVWLRMTHENQKAYRALRQVIEEYAEIIVDAQKHLERIDKKLERSSSQ